MREAARAPQLRWMAAALPPRRSGRGRIRASGIGLDNEEPFTRFLAELIEGPQWKEDGEAA
jgi:hypothetical protein